MFIVFEGIDGTGKSTQARLLSQWLDKNGVSNLLVREPGETRLGVKLRALILDDKDEVGDRAELGLYLVDRAEHVDKVVKPALDAGKTVISDRYTDSTMAYQCYGKSVLSEKQTRELNHIFSYGVQPDRVFVLDMDVNKALSRVDSRGDKDKYESKGTDFFLRVQTYYRTLKVAGYPYVYIDASQEPDIIHQMIITEMQKLIKSREPHEKN